MQQREGKEELRNNPVRSQLRRTKMEPSSTSVIGKKRYISAFSLLAVALVSSEGQQQLLKFTPSILSRPFIGFEYVIGVTPLSHWIWPAIFCSMYLVTIIGLSFWMKNRKAVEMFKFPVAHNFLLCFGSLIMLIGFIKETYIVYEKHGVEALWCDSNHRQREGNLFFWYYVFFLSKFYEFLDTVILILRKKPLSFLHCFHHFITAFLCWLGLYTDMSIQWIVVSLNAMVHVFMYYYYLAQTLNLDVWWKKYLTTAQIVQFMLDIALSSGWYYYSFSLGMKCSGNVATLVFTHSVLGSFLILFLNFFIQTYIKKSRRRQAGEEVQPAQVKKVN